jgi:hypothetical protein
LNLFVVTNRSIHRLKKNSFGFYEHASKCICVSDNPFQSNDVRNTGFFLRKSAAKIDKAHFTPQVIQRLSDFPFSDEDSSRCNESKEALPFEGPLLSDDICHASAAGRVKTTGICCHETEGHPHEQFVPHSLLHGNDTINQKAHRNAIMLQNKCLAEMCVVPVVGVSPKALQETIRVGNSQPQSVINLILNTNISPALNQLPNPPKLGSIFSLPLPPSLTKPNNSLWKQSLKHGLHTKTLSSTNSPHQLNACDS